MLVRTLDNHEYKWQMKVAAATIRSGPHQKVKELLQKQYPTAQILEEVQIQVKKNKDLYLDFYLPLYNIAIEINGEQHRKLVSHFTKTQSQFVNLQTNDKLKQRWCELNQITFISLDDNEKEEDWLNKF